MRGRHGNHARSVEHARWSNERMIASNGYAKVRVGCGHPLADPNGYAYEHLVVWCAAGRSRPGNGEVIHHLNGQKIDNRLENLELKKRSAHGIGHQSFAISDDQVRALRERHAEGKDTGELAREFGVPIQRAWKIVRGLSRRDADGPIHEAPLRQTRASRLLDGREHNDMPRCHRSERDK